MKEIIWHGRGGQGAFTAARLLGAAYTINNANHFALSFPTFGPERRGAPVKAFTKLSDEYVGDRSQIKKADYVIYLDETLFIPENEPLQELKQGGRILINSSDEKKASENVIIIDADRIALEVIGRPIANTTMMGAVAGLDSDIDLKDIEDAISQYMSAALRDKNIEAVRRSAKAIKDLK